MQKFVFSRIAHRRQSSNRFYRIAKFFVQISHVRFHFWLPFVHVFLFVRYGYVAYAVVSATPDVVHFALLLSTFSEISYARKCNLMKSLPAQVFSSLRISAPLCFCYSFSSNS